MRKVGGGSIEKAVKAALRALMTKNLMAQFNKVGMGTKGLKGHTVVEADTW